MGHWALKRTACAGLMLLLLMTLAAPSAFGQQKPVDVATVGPQIGARVPSFVLPDQHGRSQTFESLTGRGGLMLVFLQSTDWCPYCRAQLLEIQSRLKDLRDSGLNVAAISSDPVPTLAGFARQRNVTFPLLSDAATEVIRRYGLLNTIVDSSDQLFGSPFPGTLLIDRRGVVTSRHFERSDQERNTVASVLVRSGRALSVPVRRVAPPNIEITSYVTDQAAAPGARLSVALDITPGSRIHVYAPGAVGYKSVALEVERQPGLIVRDLHYPKPETYFFAPLKERVLAYQRPFRIVQDLTIDAARDGQASLRGKTELTINATLSYQACDDEVCFTPQTVPLSWTVDVIPLEW